MQPSFFEKLGNKITGYRQMLEGLPLRMELVRDAARLKSSLRFLDALGPPPETGPHAVFFSLGGSLYLSKVEGMLALGLRLRGCRTTVVMQSRDGTDILRRNYEAFGVRDFLYVSDLTAEAPELSEDARRLQDLANKCRRFSELKRLRYRDTRLGQQILATISRARFEGAPDIEDPAIRADFQNMIPYGLQRIDLARQVAAALKPDLALTVEPNYIHWAPFMDEALAAGAEGIHYFQPWRDDAIMFKRLTAATRYDHPSSVSEATFARYSDRPLDEAEDRALDEEFDKRYSGFWQLQKRNQPDTAPFSRDALMTEFGFDGNRKLAVIFSPVLWDANMFYGEDLFEDFGEWYVETVKAANANDKVNWLIKAHPANIWKRQRGKAGSILSEQTLIDQRVGGLRPHVKLLLPDTKVSSLSLFQAADVGVTIRGTAGMEMPCFGVPVVTAGTGRYSGLGFTEDSDSAAAYLARLAAVQDLPRLTQHQIGLARRHAHLVFLRRSWPMKSFRSVLSYGTRPLDHPLLQSLEPAVGSLKDIEQNGDLFAWAEWAMGSRDLDFLNGGDG